MPDPYCHLIGRQAIADAFGTTPQTVSTWAHEGAPIFYAGKTLQANYEHLLAWLETVKRPKRKTRRACRDSLMPQKREKRQTAKTCQALF